MSQTNVRTIRVSEHGLEEDGAPVRRTREARHDLGVPGDLQVLLVAMPFATLGPSIALGTVKATLDQAGFRCGTLHADLEYLQFLLKAGALPSPQAYQALGGMAIFNEWVFTTEDFHGLDRVPTREEVGEWNATFPRLREQTRRFIENMATQIVAAGPAIVGFSLVFSQSVASLVLARRLKELAPGLTVLLGGIGCAGGIGDALLRHFPWVDAVYFGDAEGGLPDLVRQLLAGDRSGHPSASVRRGDGSIAFGGCVHKAAGEAFATPDYDEYFARLGRLGLENLATRMFIPFESSRGCWWGDKHACTFCATNVTMAYRRKPRERVVEELCFLSDRHATCAFAATDSILDYRETQAFCQSLAQAGHDWDLYYMTKSNLTCEELFHLKEAGVAHLTPGIESLSTPILKLMNKGARAIQNLRMLKFCQWLGIHVDWSILCGFPTEDPAEYGRMAALARTLHHLEPPKGVFPIFLERGSAFFDRPREMGVELTGAYAAYNYLYPLPATGIEELAHRFSYRHLDGRTVSDYTAELAAAVAQWEEAHNQGKARLVYNRIGARTLVTALRQGSSRRHLLNPAESLLYGKCLDLTSLETLGEDPEVRAAGLGPEAIEAFASAMVQLGLLYREGRQLLGLALPHHPPRLPLG